LTQHHSVSFIEGKLVVTHQGRLAHVDGQVSELRNAIRLQGDHAGPLGEGWELEQNSSPVGVEGRIVNAHAVEDEEGARSTLVHFSRDQTQAQHQPQHHLRSWKLKCRTPQIRVTRATGRGDGSLRCQMLPHGLHCNMMGWVFS